MDDEIIYSWCFKFVECFDLTSSAAIIVLVKNLESLSSLRSNSVKVSLDPHKDHESHKDLDEEKDDQSSPMIIPEEDSEDDEAPDEELIRAEPNPEVYKPPMPYPHLLSRPTPRRA